MALTLWDPFSTLNRLDREFDDLMRRAWGGGRGSVSGTAGYVPAVEMRTDGEDVLIRLELPGVDVQSDVDIEVAEGRLTISGQRKDRAESESGRVLVRELRYGSFRREFALPEGVTSEEVEASYDRGMLEVRIRHVAKPVTPKKVAIRARDSRPAIEGESSPAS